MQFEHDDAEPARHAPRGEYVIVAPPSGSPFVSSIVVLTSCEEPIEKRYAAWKDRDKASLNKGVYVDGGILVYCRVFAENRVYTGKWYVSV